MEVMNGGMNGGMNNGMMPMGGIGRAPPQYDGRRPSDPSAPIDGYTNPSPQPPGGYVAYNPSEVRPTSLPRAESPPPLENMEDIGMVGQAIEMDASTGSPSHPPAGFAGQFGNLRDSDGDVAGMRDEYVQPKQAWEQQEGRSSPLNPTSQAHELPPAQPTHKRGNSNDDYYEDVDPRFADPAPIQNPSPPVPTIRIPGHPSGNNLDPNSHLHPNPLSNLDGNNSYNSLEELQSGNALQPNQKDQISHLFHNGGSTRDGMVARREDVLLNDNPDFALPLGRGGRGPPRVMRGGILCSKALNVGYRFRSSLFTIKRIWDGYLGKCMAGGWVMGGWAVGLEGKRNEMASHVIVSGMDECSKVLQSKSRWVTGLASREQIKDIFQSSIKC
ncbi:hypothetical protein EYC84_006283 [Monilinia fructicola]|uniref:Uncharacterized protein n=1 Tax=Monilinia fructicola TaxID=38448 RepID=A0A5M9K7R5_MONFR|nr:hypothetical protein EYC84_006283 [Monilinia fructicola]